MLQGTGDAEKLAIALQFTTLAMGKYVTSSVNKELTTCSASLPNLLSYLTTIAIRYCRALFSPK